MKMPSVTTSNDWWLIEQEWKRLAQSNIKDLLFVNVVKWSKEKEEIRNHWIYAIWRLKRIQEFLRDFKIHNSIKDAWLAPFIEQMNQTVKVLIERTENYIMHKLLD